MYLSKNCKAQEEEDGEEAEAPKPASASAAAFWPAPGSPRLPGEPIVIDGGDDASVAPSQGMLQRFPSRTSLLTPSTGKSKKKAASVAPEGLELESQDGTDIYKEEGGCIQDIPKVAPSCCSAKHINSLTKEVLE